MLTKGLGIMAAYKQSTGERLTEADTIMAINWNELDTAEKEQNETVWQRLTGNFWLPEKVPLSNDIPSYATLTDAEKDVFAKVFAGLTLLDTCQSIGAKCMVEDAQDLIEEACLYNLEFMEAVHAKSYSSIFSTLLSTPEINEAFRWSRENPQLQRKAKTIVNIYHGDDPLKKKVASVLLESFLFYSGFYLPFHLSAHAKCTNTADIIRLILRDEAVHGYFIGQRYQSLLRNVFHGSRDAEMRAFVDEIATDLYENELVYTHDLYDELGLSEEVTSFMQYNANKAYMNLGYEKGLFEPSTIHVAAEIMSSLNPGADENHDFFSGSGSSYVMGKAVATQDDDWDF